VFYSTKSKCFIEIKDLNLATQASSDEIEKAIKVQDYNINRLEVFQRVVLDYNQ
jgi:hypothetical protein